MTGISQLEANCISGYTVIPNRDTCRPAVPADNESPRAIQFAILIFLILIVGIPSYVGSVNLMVGSKRKRTKAEASPGRSRNRAAQSVQDTDQAGFGHQHTRLGL